MYSSGDAYEYDSLKQAKDQILYNFTETYSDLPELPMLVTELDENGEEVKDYGCTWDVTINEL
jgi:hypothetical protein